MADERNVYKTEGFKWTRGQILLLISLIKENFHQLQTGKKKVAHQKIAKQINAKLGTSLNYEQVDSKWKGIKRTYVKLRNSNTDLRQAQRCWEYYDAVDEILKNTPEFNPQSAMSTEDYIATDYDAEFNYVDCNEVSTSSPSPSRSRKRRHSNSEDIEEAKERRHQEKMKMARKFLNIFQEMVDKM